MIKENLPKGFIVSGYIFVKKSQPLEGITTLNGAKNAVLVIIASLILTKGKSTLENVPNNADVSHMIKLLEDLGAIVEFDIKHSKLTVDTTGISSYEVKPEVMNKMRASILVMGPLLARFGYAKVALPGGCLLGARPINFHLKGFAQLGVAIAEEGPFLFAKAQNFPSNSRIIFEYPSVGATENIMMMAALSNGETTIINAALEPEVLDLIDVLKKMGGNIKIKEGSVLVITGSNKLNPISHTIVPDRLEAGTLLLAAAATGGSITISNARPEHMDVFLEKLKEMGHSVLTRFDDQKIRGISLKATRYPQAINFKTGPYPGFPTDLQAPTMAALCLADGISTIEETVFENRMIHTTQLQKMGAQITADNTKAIIRGVDELYGCEVIASDIRASCALVIAGLCSFGSTKITGIHHWNRGYDRLENKINKLGGSIQTKAIEQESLQPTL